MSSKENHIKRAVFDRRTSLDRRIVNWGAKDPDHERRIGRNRRQNWGKKRRVEADQSMEQFANTL